MKNADAVYTDHHAEKFVAAILEFQDPVELLFRLTSPKVLNSGIL